MKFQLDFLKRKELENLPFKSLNNRDELFTLRDCI